MESEITRRCVVRGALSAGAAALMGGTLLSPSDVAAAERSRPGAAGKRPTSRNGWEIVDQVNDATMVWTRPVPGTGFGVDVRIGEVEKVLVHLIRRFHYEIDELGPGEVVGWRAPVEVDLRRPQGNSASGTAVTIRPGWYPPGVSGGFFPNELVVIRDVLAELDGVVRWGGDDRNCYEALFYLDARPGDERLQRLVRRMGGWQDAADQGAGTPVDVTAPARREAAKSLKRRQSGTG